MCRHENAFQKCSKIEKASFEIIYEWLEDKTLKIFPFNEEDWQKNYGDFVAVKEDVAKRVDLKAEERWTGNIFAETWSNRTYNFANPGWMHHLKADQIWYFFFDTRKLIFIEFKEFKEWFDKQEYNYTDEYGNKSIKPNSWMFKEKVQDKHKQKNITVGRIVPIQFLINNKFAKEIQL